ncbi:hypothetical protein D9Q98_002436 [Chlorella vulgaris]|uniref:Uncharacterized protein n=1 Tax=Chlorella vulgaris TaxID=3077 RepID=A0A9D4Z195_CHLVU|nr:hypothetical protein D9Q98_002436 [Chlorella vulgaris]
MAVLLGITFQASNCIAGAAAPARAVAARAAMHSCNARCAALRVEAAPLQLRLIGTMVDAVLSCGLEVWGMQLAAASTAGKTSSAAGSKAEGLHQAHLRRLLGGAARHTNRCGAGGGGRAAAAAALAAAGSQAVEPGGDS